jgi:hypothetical protein
MFKDVTLQRAASVLRRLSSCYYSFIRSFIYSKDKNHNVETHKNILAIVSEENVKVVDLLSFVNNQYVGFDDCGGYIRLRVTGATKVNIRIF